MKKKLVMRGLLGIPLGIAICFVVTVLISLWIGDGTFYPVTEYLLETAGSELNAVVLQTVLSCLLGAGMGMASVIWEMESWSLAKQTGTYLAVICVVYFPVAYATGWMAHTASGVGTYVIIFAIIFVIIWLLQYWIWKGRVRTLNEKLHQQ